MVIIIAATPTAVAPTERRIMKREKACCLEKANLFAIKKEVFNWNGF
jgi:hypothetical protein